MSNHHGLAKEEDLQWDTLCLRPVTFQYDVVRLTEFAILQSGLNLSDVLVALHRFPSSHAPVFLGWHLNGVGPLPLQRRPL